MDFILHLLYLIRHLDQTIETFARQHGSGVYALLAAIIFCETGLVVTPFLPGDSLLFAVGALAAKPNSPIELPIVFLLLCLAANSGDALNYFLGYRVGPKIFSKQTSFLLNKKHLDEAQRFYDRHGRATIILARFVPIIRTFAPFVAGIGKMNFFKFALFSVTGGILWVVCLTTAGYYFGGIPWVKTHFEMVIVAIIVISVIPAILHYLQARKRAGVEVGKE